MATSTHGPSRAAPSGATPPPVAAAMPLYGRLELFEGDGANDTPEAKQRQIFLASCGTRIFSLLLDLLKPTPPHVKTLRELLAVLRSHINPAPSTLMERFRFNNRSQREGDTVRPLVAAPRSASSLKHNAFRAGKLGTWHGYAERGGRTSKQQQQPGSSPGSKQVRGEGSRRKGTRRGRAAAGSSSSAARLHVVAEDPPIFDMWYTGFVPLCVAPYMLTVEICGHPISMELDTGASVSLMAGKLFKRTFPGVFVEASGVMMYSYSGQLSQVQGQAQDSVRFGDRKPRTLPFGLKDRVIKELQRLQREGILVPVKTSEWAASIVPVLKRDGSVRICKDFKVTINHVVTVEKYPLPCIEDLWSALCGGQKFTKLDLRDAYQELVLQDASRKYLTVSMTLGFFQYMRLPFGGASAPVIFHGEMDNLCRCMRHVAVYLDDILVTGSEVGDHLQNLCNVLAPLQDAGLKLKLEKCIFLAPLFSTWDMSFPRWPSLGTLQNWCCAQGA
ncbi:uncharacterized protein [Dermacentor albipictus]|uniref:uncharacterized protein n=1 Tax=Dermacentor albipictus TaxID=60249 RepID=UPI0038FD30EA